MGALGERTFLYIAAPVGAVLLRLFLEEVFDVFFAYPVNSAELDASDLLLFDEFQNSKVMKPEHLGDFFGSE